MSRAKGPPAFFGQDQGLPAAVVLEPPACQQAAFFERCEQLRDGRRRDRGAARKLGPDDLSLGDCLQGQELGHRPLHAGLQQQPVDRMGQAQAVQQGVRPRALGVAALLEYRDPLAGTGAMAVALPRMLPPSQST